MCPLQVMIILLPLCICMASAEAALTHHLTMWLLVSSSLRARLLVLRSYQNTLRIFFEPSSLHSRTRILGIQRTALSRGSRVWIERKLLPQGCGTKWRGLCQGATSRYKSQDSNSRFAEGVCVKILQMLDQSARRCSRLFRFAENLFLKVDNHSKVAMNITSVHRHGCEAPILLVELVS